jgi:MFS family permease
MAATAADLERHEPYAALRIRSFRWFIASMLTMTMGTQVQAVAVGWQVYQITRDPFALGLIGLAEVIPYVSVALFAGYVVDRGDRRLISLGGLTVLLLAAAAFLAFAARGLPADVWPYYTIIGVTGLARSFLQSSRSALVSEIVPRGLYANAATWRSSTWQLGTVLGPALGGLVLGTFGARWAYVVNAVLATTALACMAMIRYTPQPRSVVSASMRESLAEGVRFVRGQRVILGALTLDMFAVFFGGAVALLPVFAAEVLHVGPRGLGALQAAPGAGAVLMALYVAHRRPFRQAGRTLFTCVAIFGVCMIGFALSKVFWFSWALLFVAGAADNVSAVIRSTLIQVLTPGEMLGRVSAVNAIFVGSSNELGAFESGAAAKLLGTVPSVVFGGAMTLFVVASMMWKLPELRRLGAIVREAPTD